MLAVIKFSTIEKYPTMVEEFELNSFIKTFKNLWNAGLSAHLDLDTCAGKPWVGLRLELGDEPDHQHHHHHDRYHQKSRNSPTTESRRNRREDLRKSTTDQSDAAEKAKSIEKVAVESIEEVETEAEDQNITEKADIEKENNDVQGASKKV